MSKAREWINRLLDKGNLHDLEEVLGYSAYPGPHTKASDVVQLNAIGVILDKLCLIEERLAAIEKDGGHGGS